VMIKWSNLPVSEATWENLTEFSKTYPMLWIRTKKWLL
jgi:hypothetical protein